MKFKCHLLAMVHTNFDYSTTRFPAHHVHAASVNFSKSVFLLVFLALVLLVFFNRLRIFMSWKSLFFCKMDKLQMETPPPPEPKKRRASRGRRSSILFKADGASPTVVNAPINESIQGNTAVEKVYLLNICFIIEYYR